MNIFSLFRFSFCYSFANRRFLEIFFILIFDLKIKYGDPGKRGDERRDFRY
jgi:hypothetical protein